MWYRCYKLFIIRKKFSKQQLLNETISCLCIPACAQMYGFVYERIRVKKKHLTCWEENKEGHFEKISAKDIVRKKRSIQSENVSVTKCWLGAKIRNPSVCHEIFKHTWRGSGCYERHDEMMAVWTEKEQWEYCASLKSPCTYI